MFLNQNHRVYPISANLFLKLRRIFRPKSEIQSPKTGDLKKKGLHRNQDGVFDQNRNSKRFFSPNSGDLQKKKRSSPKLRRSFQPKSEFQTLFQAESRHLLHNFGTQQFPLGGLFLFFHQKLASKAPKTCNFAYFTGQWGGSSPPWLHY